MKEPKIHLNDPDDKSGWKSICGIHTSSIVDDVEYEGVDCERCLKILETLDE
jgi:hypothetical protein